MSSGSTDESADEKPDSTAMSREQVGQGPRLAAAGINPRGQVSGKIVRRRRRQVRAIGSAGVLDAVAHNHSSSSSCSLPGWKTCAGNVGEAWRP